MTLSDGIRCRTVPQFFHKWGITPVIWHFREILEPANPHKHWVCENLLKILALTS